MQQAWLHPKDKSRRNIEMTLNRTLDADGFRMRQASTES